MKTCQSCFKGYEGHERSLICPKCMTHVRNYHINEKRIREQKKCSAFLRFA